MPDFALQRRMMVDGQLRTYDVTQAGVIAAMGSVPREAFVEEADRAVAYVDSPLAVAGSAGTRTLLTPMVLGRLIQTAEINPEDRVLDVACATGYSAAVLSRLAAEVIAVESDSVLAERARGALSALGCANVSVVTGALDKGAADRGPYDVIFVGGSFEVEPQALLDQLKDGGRLVGVMGTGRAGRAMIYRRSGQTVSGRVAFDAAAPSLAEFRRPPEFVF
jgi:protein-L-isoaspartate(D-aspartate) O-methyltransferase